MLCGMHVSLMECKTRMGSSQVGFVHQVKQAVRTTVHITLMQRQTSVGGCQHEMLGSREG